jgi:hypothetical protein
MKIVINDCYGGFGLSEEAEELYIQKKNISGSLRGDILRNDSVLVEVVETLGDKASGIYSKLKVVEIPDDVTDWRIEEYDGWEHIAEGRKWYGS